MFNILRLTVVSFSDFVITEVNTDRNGPQTVQTTDRKDQ